MYSPGVQACCARADEGTIRAARVHAIETRVRTRYRFMLGTPKRRAAWSNRESRFPTLPGRRRRSGSAAEKNQKIDQQCRGVSNHRAERDLTSKMSSGLHDEQTAEKRCQEPFFPFWLVLGADGAVPSELVDHSVWPALIAKTRASNQTSADQEEISCRIRRGRDPPMSKDTIRP